MVTDRSVRFACYWDDHADSMDGNIERCRSMTRIKKLLILISLHTLEIAVSSIELLFLYHTDKVVAEEQRQGVASLKFELK